MLPEYSLEGKVAIVTGAGRGIGKGTALAMAEAGADIVAVARTREEIEATAKEVRKLGKRAIAIPADITKAEQVENFVRGALKEFGRIDILVNNAGTGIRKHIVPLPGYIPSWAKNIPNFNTPSTEEEWRTVIDTNLTGTFLCCRAAGPHMLERRQGKVINVSSIEGSMGMAYGVHYTTSKAAVNMFTRSLALEWARYNIQVNAIGPGLVETKATQDVFDKESWAKLLQTVPMRRCGTPRDIALLAVYLASPAADYITGQIVNIDGGKLAG